MAVPCTRSSFRTPVFAVLTLLVSYACEPNTSMATGAEDRKTRQNPAIIGHFARTDLIRTVWLARCGRRQRQALGVSLPRLARTVTHRRLAAAPLRIAWQIVEHLEPWELFVGMRVE